MQEGDIVVRVLFPNKGVETKTAGIRYVITRIAKRQPGKMYVKTIGNTKRGLGTPVLISDFALAPEAPPTGADTSTPEGSGVGAHKES